MAKNTLSSVKEAKNTGKWAKTLAKVAIRYSSRGRKRWQIVSFEGPKGGESTGIVDFIVIRRDHKSKSTKKHPLKAGDLFEIILVQSKGGCSKRPTEAHIRRLLRVGRYYHAKHIILTSWQKGNIPIFYRLKGLSWQPVEPIVIFGE